MHLFSSFSFGPVPCGSLNLLERRRAIGNTSAPMEKEWDMELGLEIKEWEERRRKLRRTPVGVSVGRLQQVRRASLHPRADGVWKEMRQVVREGARLPAQHSL